MARIAVVQWSTFCIHFLLVLFGFPLLDYLLLLLVFDFAQLLRGFAFGRRVHLPVGFWREIAQCGRRPLLVEEPDVPLDEQGHVAAMGYVEVNEHLDLRPPVYCLHRPVVRGPPDVKEGKLDSLPTHLCYKEDALWRAYGNA